MCRSGCEPHSKGRTRERWHTAADGFLLLIISSFICRLWRKTKVLQKRPPCSESGMEVILHERHRSPRIRDGGEGVLCFPRLHISLNKSQSHSPEVLASKTFLMSILKVAGELQLHLLAFFPCNLKVQMICKNMYFLLSSPE